MYPRMLDAVAGLIVRFLIALALVSLCAVPPALAVDSASLPRCAPFEDSPQFIGFVTHYSIIDPAGLWVLWNCYAVQIGTLPVRTRHCLEAPWSAIDLRRLGDRVDTVRSAPAPLVAWTTAYKRYVGPAASARCVALLKANP